MVRSRISFQAFTIAVEHTRMMENTRDIWRRLSDFQLDEPGVTLPYSKRLAQENGWSRDFTDRVIDEYKRFLLLATTSPRPVTPSKAIDRAWHLHLTYSRSYWNTLCTHVLQRPLHHDPTTGGQDEESKFSVQYDDTMAQYEKIFRSPPPDDIWGATVLQHQAATGVPLSTFRHRLSALTGLPGRTILLLTMLFFTLIVTVGLANATVISDPDQHSWVQSFATMLGWNGGNAGFMTVVTIGIILCVATVFLLLHCSIPQSSRRRRHPKGANCGGCSGGPSCGGSCSGGSCGGD